MHLFDASTHEYLGFVNVPPLDPRMPGFALAPRGAAVASYSTDEPSPAPVPSVVIAFFPADRPVVCVVTAGRERLCDCDRFCAPDPNEFQPTWRDVERLIAR